MKKLMLLLTLAIMSISSICHAFEQPDPNRWVWLNSNDKYGFWLDKQTLKFEKINKLSTHQGHNSANVWIQVYNAETDQVALQNVILDFDCTLLGPVSITLYDTNRTLINSYNHPVIEFTPIIPDTNGEFIYLVVKSIKEEKDNTY